MQSSKKEILNYIRNEKQISEFKINSIKASRSLSPSNKRIQKIEEDFVQLPLENMFFDSISDVATAIKLYRTSPHIFYRTYGISKEGRHNKQDLKLNNANTSIILFRLKEIERIHLELKKLELNQSGFFATLSEDDKRLFEKNKDKILKYTKRAISACRYYIDIELKSFKAKTLNSICLETGNNLKNLSPKELQDVFEILTSIHDGICKRSLQYFNSLTKTKKKILENLLDKGSLLETLVKIPVIRYSLEKDCKNKIQRKIAGVRLNIKTKNNELRQPVALNICINGVNITNLFCLKTSNIKINNCYEKAIMIKPISSFSDEDFETLSKLKQQFEMSKLELAKQLEDVKEELDNTSFLFAPISRREGEHFSIVYKWFNYELSCIGV